MTEEEKANRIAQILQTAKAMGIEMTEADALTQFEVENPTESGSGDSSGSDYDVNSKTNTDEPWKLGAAGNASALAKLTSLGFGAASLSGAEDRQDTTVSNLNKLADKVGTPVDVDDSGVNLAELNARDDADANASTLATLLQSGVDPAAAQQIVSKQQKGQTSELLNQLNLQGNKQQTADEAAMARRSKIDAAATQAGMPIDKSAGISDLFSKAGDLAAGYSALTNPLPTTARSGRKLMYEDGGSLPSPVTELLGILGRHSKPGNTRTGNMPVGQQASIQYLSKATEGLSPQAKAHIMRARMESGDDEMVASAVYDTLNPTSKYENGGGLQTTQGPSDHSENPMLITNPDGSPATDAQGNQIEVTGKETIIPDWLMEQLIEAANKGPKELKKVFKDEIIDEERFNQA